MNSNFSYSRYENYNYNKNFYMTKLYKISYSECELWLLIQNVKIPIDFFKCWLAFALACRWKLQRHKRYEIHNLQSFSSTRSQIVRFCRSDDNSRKDASLGRPRKLQNDNYVGESMRAEWERSEKALQRRRMATGGRKYSTYHRRQSHGHVTIGSAQSDRIAIE